jgi:hypothetical protein
MTISAIENSVKGLNELILGGKGMEAFDIYYDDEVVMQENEQEPTVVKKANRQRELQFYSDIIDFRGAKALHAAVGENVSYVTWHFDYTHKEWGVRNYTQVSVQHWKDGKIIKEQFFYGN